MKIKGFTLVEQLAVIIILVILTIIVFPGLISTFKTKEEKVEQVIVDILYNSTDNYIQEHGDDYSAENGTSYCIPISDIDREGFIPVDVSKYLDKGIQVKIGKINSYKIVTCDKN